MNRLTPRILVYAGLSALVVVLAGCRGLFFRHHVIIISQPQSQTVAMGTNVTFSVLAAKGPPYTTNGLSYQWQFNHTVLNGNLHWTNLTISGATNSSITITNAQTNDVGYYRVLVSGSPTTASDPAGLQVFSSTAGGVTVYGTPVVSGATGFCGGGTVHFHINYTNSPPLWGWGVISPTSVTSCENAGGRTDTKFEYLGLEAFDQKCTAGSLITVSMAKTPFPPHTPSSRYIFTLYFTDTTTPPSPYPVLLTNLR